MLPQSEENTIKAKLCLLAKRTRLHGWARFDNGDEATFEEEEAKIDAGQLRITHRQQLWNLSYSLLLCNRGLLH